MARLIWSVRALEDVQRLYQFLAPRNPDAAQRAAQTIRQGVAILAEHPGIGRPATAMSPEFRERSIRFGDSGYVALYRFDRESAIILAVRHQREAGW